MAQVSHRTLMQMPFMGMAVRPNALLSKCALGIKKIWMSLKLDVAGLAQPLLMGVMISPGKKFSRRLLATLQHIAAVANRKGTKNGFHGARPRFDAIIL